MDQGLVWQALKWPDGTRYEGLTKNGVLHSHGVLTFPNSDRYEGMFEDGRMSGAGAYVWKSGMRAEHRLLTKPQQLALKSPCPHQMHLLFWVYRGDWSHGCMHGCGTAIWKQPEQEVSAAEGKFFANEFVGDVMPCSKADGYESAVEADMAAYQARSFTQWRSTGEKGEVKKSQQQQQHAGGVGSSRKAANLTTSSEVKTAATAYDGGMGGLSEQQHVKLQGLVQRLALQQQVGPD